MAVETFSNLSECNNFSVELGLSGAGKFWMKAPVVD